MAEQITLKKILQDQTLRNSVPAAKPKPGRFAKLRAPTPKVRSTKPTTKKAGD